MVAYKAHEEMIEFIKQYFLDELEGTINTCAREAAACGVPVRRDVIVSVRRDMADEIRKAREEHAYRVKHPVPAPILSIVRPAQMVMPKLDIPAPEESNKGSVPIGDRRKYYDDIVLGDADITITRAMKAVTAKYGMSVDVRYALASLRLSRELHNQTATEVVVNPKAPMNPIKGLPERIVVKPQEVIKPAAQTPKPQAPEEAEHYLLKYTLNGAPHEEMIKKNELNMALLKLVAQGVSQSTLRVYQPVKFKLNVSIDFG